MDEVERIKEAYVRRDASGRKHLYAMCNPAALFMEQQREKTLLRLLFRKASVSELSSLKILDMGCGNGSVLRNFVKYGAMPENCSGIDLLPDRIAMAQHISPNMDFQCGNAESLPYDTACFNLIICFTVFTSIFDGQMKQHIASEMLRVLQPDGMILWYDYHMNNPRNPDVRGVKAGEIRALFSECDITLKRITLAPPLTRAIAPFSVIACQLLEKLPFLCTHYLGIIRKK